MSSKLPPGKGSAITAKLFVGNLNFATTQDEVRTLFAQAGTLSDVFLPLDRATGKPRGFAFVEYENAADAQDAIEKFNGHELGGRQLRVSEAQERVRRAPSFQPSPREYDSGPPPDFGREGKPKGSRRNLRARKRSL